MLLRAQMNRSKHECHVTNIKTLDYSSQRTHVFVICNDWTIHVFLREWSLFMYSPHFMEPEDSLPHSPVPFLNQIDPVHTPTSYFLKIHLNIILPSTSVSSKWSLSLRFLHQNPVCTSLIPHMFYVPRPSNFSLFHHRNIWWAVQVITLLNM